MTTGVVTMSFCLLELSNRNQQEEDLASRWTTAEGCSTKSASEWSSMRGSGSSDVCDCTHHEKLKFKLMLILAIVACATRWTGVS